MVCDFKIANLYYKKIRNTVVNKYTVCSSTKSKIIYFSGNQQLYLLHIVIPN